MLVELTQLIGERVAFPSSDGELLARAVGSGGRAQPFFRVLRRHAHRTLVRRLKLLHFSTRRRLGSLQLDEVGFDFAERATCPALVSFGVVQAVPRGLDFG